MFERAFVMVKPHAVWDWRGILERLDCVEDLDVCRYAKAMVDSVPREVVEAHYAEHIDKEVFPRLVHQFEGSRVVVAAYEGKTGLIPIFRGLIGPTDPTEAPSHTIRGDPIYGRDSIAIATREGRGLNNVVHCSADQSAAEYELRVWKKYLNPNKE